MKKMKTTNQKIRMFAEAAGTYVAENKETTKLTYALNKVKKSAIQLLEKYNSQLDDIKIDHAAVDEKQHVLYLKNEVTGNVIDYQYTKEGKKACNNAIRSLYTEQTVDIEPHICKDTTGIDKMYFDAFAGFVIEVTEEVEPE